MKTSKLTGIALDWAVGKANGWISYPTDSVEKGQWWHTDSTLAPHGFDHNRVAVADYRPSTNWAQGGPIIEQEGIALQRWLETGWIADRWNFRFVPGHNQGETPLIAAMRCYVAHKLGDEVEIVVPTNCDEISVADWW